MARSAPRSPRVGTARRRRPTPCGDAAPYLRETETARPEVRGLDGAAPLPIDTKGAAAPWREAPHVSPRVGTARRRRPTPCGEGAPHLRETATARPEVKGPDGAAPLPIDTKGAAAPWREALHVPRG